MTSRTTQQQQTAAPGSRLDAEAARGYLNAFGFIPNAAVAQTAVPRLIEAERGVAAALAAGALSAERQEWLQLAVAVGHENVYEAALRSHALLRLGVDRERIHRFVFDYREAELPDADCALLGFVLALARHPTRIAAEDIELVRRHGFGDGAIVEAAFLTAWANYRCVSAAGLGVAPDLEAPWIPPETLRKTAFRPVHKASLEPASASGPFVHAPELSAESFPLFTRLQARDGAVPNVLRAQTLRPDLILAQTGLIERVLLAPGKLSRMRKEHIFLAVSARNLSVYCVALHDAVLRSLGQPSRQSERIAVDHWQADLSDADHALLDAALELAARPSGSPGAKLSELARSGFSAEEIVEAVAVVAVAYLANTLSTALGAEPDFPTQIDLAGAHPFPAARHQTDAGSPAADERPDPDAEAVAKVRTGDSDAFEELVRRHGRRIHRTLGGVLRGADDVEAAVQETFLRAYQNLDRFEGRSLFVTWLTRVAINIGLQRLRRRKHIESLDEDPTAIERIQPRQIQPWQDTPERKYSRAETRDLIVKAVEALPLKYRTAVLLRDFQQLSTREAATALGVSVAALKARLFRARMMLREALTPHFARSEK